jgi:hypothetical protein
MICSSPRTQRGKNIFSSDRIRLVNVSLSQIASCWRGSALAAPHLDTVGGQQAVRIAVGAQDAGQDHRVEGVGLAAGGSVAVPVPVTASGLSETWSGRPHPGHQQPAADLDRHLHVPGRRVVQREKLEQAGQPGRVVCRSVRR